MSMKHPFPEPTYTTRPSTRTPLTLLLANTNSPAPSAGSLGVLSTDTETPVVAETSVSTDLLQSLEVVTELGVDTVGENLEVLAVDNVALSVEEPGRNLVLGWVLDDGDDTLELFRGEFSGANRSVRILIFPTRSHATNRLLRSTSAFLQTKLE